MLNHLNAPQREAVLAEGHCLVAALPGSGKTRVLTVKAAHLFRQLRDSARIVAVTFTNKSADEMAERIGKILGEAKKNIVTGTFHSICFKQLKKAGYNLQLANTAQHFGLLRRALQLTGLDLSMEDAQMLLESAKTDLDYEPQDDEKGALYLAYQELLHRNHLVDFHDLLLITVKGMREGKIPPLGATHLFVDEFQDTDRVQYEWARLHGINGTKITAVGDDDQCIYSWRAAMGYDGMVRFERDFQAKRIILDINYRSHAEILHSAFTLIANNTTRLTKRPIAARGPGGSTTYKRFKDRAEEADAIVKAAREAPHQWAVLARTNRLLEYIEGALLAEGVPHERGDDGTLWEREPVAHFLTLIQGCLHATRKAKGIEHTLRWAGISESDLARIAGADAIHNMTIPLDLSESGKKFFKHFLVLFGGWREAMQNGREPLALTGISRWLKEVGAKDTYIGSVDPAQHILGRMKGTMAQRLASISQAGKSKRTGEGVKLLTIHRAKGLEFDNVWICGAEQRYIPGERGVVPEERRNMFVGMTRAKNRLIVSSVDGSPVSCFVVESGLKASTG